jgi:hypothetical protein
MSARVRRSVAAEFSVDDNNPMHIPSYRAH